MALRKEPSRRYGSVAQFADDVRRHLEGHPVLARRDTLAYRTATFVKRNKAAVVSVSAAVIVTIAAVASPLFISSDQGRLRDGRAARQIARGAAAGQPVR